MSSFEKALLVGVEFPGNPPLNFSLSELKGLAETAGATVVETLTQKRSRPDQKYFIGSGKLEELKSLVNTCGANLIVFDHELSPAQERNLEEALAIKIIDRTELILDIFAQHAKSREGRLQVELAQASFSLGRLTGHGVMLSRLGGGIGTRGPGESKLEYDRRRLRARISFLKEGIEQLRKERFLKREKRRHHQIPTAAIVGYTNAGKSTLFNGLTRAGVPAEDKLFATLDPTTRRLYLPSGKIILVTDTVGFIQKLPHSLVAAFKATLEEVGEANLLLHVVDASSPYFEPQINSVYQVLEELGCITKPMITVFNKIDRLKQELPEKILTKFQPCVTLCAFQKEALDKLRSLIDAQTSFLSAPA
jgi:GTP-binding protein HflX